jgi:hypothetical protein
MDVLIAGKLYSRVLANRLIQASKDTKQSKTYRSYMLAIAEWLLQNEESFAKDVEALAKQENLI